MDRNSNILQLLYVWTPGSLPGTPQSVSPAVTTQYTVTATDAGTGCITSGNITVTVNPKPSTIVVTPSAPVINLGDVQLLTATGGTIPDVTLLNEDFNGATNAWTTENSSTSGTPANADWTLRADGYVYSSTTYHSNDNTQFYMSNSDAQGSGGITATALISPVLNTSGYSSLTLKFWHYFRYIDTDSQATVEVSTDGGSTWNPPPAASYTSTQGAASAFVQASIDLGAYINQTNLKIRFHFQDSYGWYWCIDNVTITGSASAGFTWAPLTGLYTNPDGTGSYLGGFTPTVYAKPAGTTLYTVTATSPSGYTRTQDVTVTVNSGRTLNLSSLFLEGLYNGLSTMFEAKDVTYDEFGNITGVFEKWGVGDADHITVELHASTTHYDAGCDCQVSDYPTIIYLANDVPLSTTGNASVTIPGAYNGT